MFNSPIRKRVTEYVNDMIERAETAHRDACKAIDVNAEIEKNLHLEETVEAIIGKFK